jgi:hypothetical protein
MPRGSSGSPPAPKSESNGNLPLTCPPATSGKARKRLVKSLEVDQAKPNLMTLDYQGRLHED